MGKAAGCWYPRRNEFWKAERKVARDEANLVLKVDGVGAFLMGPWWKARKAEDVMGVCLSAAVRANGRRMRKAIVCVCDEVVVRSSQSSKRQEQLHLVAAALLLSRNFPLTRPRHDEMPSASTSGLATTPNLPDPSILSRALVRHLVSCMKLFLHLVCGSCCVYM